jgi:hypothetical protein
MKPIVFLGPSMPLTEAQAILDAQFLPPAGQGDVLRALKLSPAAIGIVDGAFESRPSIWHNEILYVLSLGIPVYGAASMGALRAADLHSFGMKGCGVIFEAFRRGWLEDDDEVAVLHAPAELRWVPLTEPMVNIRASLRLARRQRLLDRVEERQLVNAGKTIFYKDLTMAHFIDTARAMNILPGRRSGELQNWLVQNRVDRKKLDCGIMLRHMARVGKKGFPRVSPIYQVEPTRTWLHTLKEAGLAPMGDPCMI